MEIIAPNTYVSPIVLDFLSSLKELNLVRYASEAASDMEFSSEQELEGAVTRAMQACVASGHEVDGNFKRIYMCSERGITYDWKLSLLAYRLVCLNGESANTNVAHMQAKLVRMME